MALKVVTVFFIIIVVLAVVGLSGIGISFIILMKNNLKVSKDLDSEYFEYLNRGYVIRFCYGYSVFADVLLTFVEVMSTALGTFIVLMDNVASYLVVVLLITSFVASALKNVLNLKYNRMAYAKAFRILEFALDDYRISEKTMEDKKRLHQANERAQEIIELFAE